MRVVPTTFRAWSNNNFRFFIAMSREDKRIRQCLAFAGVKRLHKRRPTLKDNVRILDPQS